MISALSFGFGALHVEVLRDMFMAAQYHCPAAASRPRPDAIRGMGMDPTLSLGLAGAEGG